MNKNDFLAPLAVASSGATDGKTTARYYSLPLLEQRGVGDISRLPVCMRIVLESLLRNLDGKRITEKALRGVLGWKPVAARTEEVPFVVSRVLLQDFTGVPLIVDLAAMRSAMAKRLSDSGNSANPGDPRTVEPMVPVDLVIDHSVQVDFSGREDALRLNLEIEFHRNAERYRFLKWGMQAFSGLRLVPPGIGICHQVNLEYLARGVLEKNGILYPDTLVGTDSHTTMVNGLGVLGWGVGGIEAEAAMLGQPVYFLLPDVVGVHLHGALPEGATATDLVLHVTELLRRAKVVGKFVEFHGEGARSLPAEGRATIANMAPEYGATCGYFPVDEETCAYLTATGRDQRQVDLVRSYYQAQNLFGIPLGGACDYSAVIDLDLARVSSSVAGPKRPQDRIDLVALKSAWNDLLTRKDATGYGKSPAETAGRFAIELPGFSSSGSSSLPTSVSGGGAQDPDSILNATRDINPVTEREMIDNRPTPDRVAPPLPSSLSTTPAQPHTLGHGDVAIAAITSCTNTSNPAVMLAAGLLARNAVARGLRVSPSVKTSLAPGSRVVTDYLARTGLAASLDALGFQTVGYGCTTCIGNSGPLDVAIEAAITAHDLVLASVLSGNRNFEARVHQSIKANFLMSPPLVVAFALAGRIGIDFANEALGTGSDGKLVYLRELWPSPASIESALRDAKDPAAYARLYDHVERENPMWNKIPVAAGVLYEWDAASTYIREPPYFEPEMAAAAPDDIRGARALAIFGDSVTTDHISPAGSIKPSSPAGLYLAEHGVAAADFNSYGARRGNHEVMVRGTFANIRIRNLMVAGSEGGVTQHFDDSGAPKRMSIYDAALAYRRENVPLVIFAGQEYGTGSSRDWAAKGTRLLGVRALIAQSFERIHRTNLVGMGVLPCQFADGVSALSLGLDGSERFDLIGLIDAAGEIKPRSTLTLVVHRGDGKIDNVPLTLRIDTAIEVEYFRAGGMLPYVLDQIDQVK